MLSTVHFEHAAPVLADLDLGLLMGAQARLKAGEQAAMQDLMGALAQGGKTKAFRRLAAIANSTADELIEAEQDASKMLAKETEMAKRAWKDVYQEALGFFSSLEDESPSTPDSSVAQGEAVAAPTTAPADDSPSAVS